jgi:pyroglutamyl-peptidase
MNLTGGLATARAPAAGFGTGLEWIWTMRTVLITGFGRFPGSPVNPSGIVAARLAARRRPALNGTRRVGHVFATRYDAVDRELPALLAREKPGIVVMFGVATRSREVRIEERACNRIALFPDAGRKRPATQTIARQRDALRNPLPLARLVTAARAAGVTAARSRNAGSYLCNYVYWRSLEAAAQPGGPDIVAFVHVPPVAVKAMPKKPEDRGNAAKTLAGRLVKKTPLKKTRAGTRPGRPARPGNRRRHDVGFDDLVRAGEAIVLAMTRFAPVTPQPAALAAPETAAPPAPEAEPAEQRVAPVFQTVRRWVQKFVGG